MVTVTLSGNQTVREESNVTFNCVVNGTRMFRSNWLLIFPADGRNLSSIRLQGGNFTPSNTDTSLFHVSDLFPGFQKKFTFIRINQIFDMVEVKCFNGGFTNSSFINFIST